MRFRPIFAAGKWLATGWFFGLLAVTALPVGLRGVEPEKPWKPQAIHWQPPAGAKNEEIQTHLENTFRVTAQVYSGSSPETEADFQALSQAGIRTIISVDGQPPKVELARQNGIKYLHLPMGYGAISSEQSQKIVQAVKSSTEPVFVHCHHGKHRGPAAVALACRALAGWSVSETEAWLKQAGISPGYKQMIESACQLPVPTAEEIPRLNFQLAESVPPQPLVERMLVVDEHFDALKDAAKNLGAKAAHDAKKKTAKKILGEATLAREALQELFRSKKRPTGDEFNAILGGSIAELEQVEVLLGPFEANPQADFPLEKYEASLKRLGESCVRCHQQFRDNPTSGGSLPKK